MYNISAFVMMAILMLPTVGFADDAAAIADMQRLLVSLKAQLASIQQQRSEAALLKGTLSITRSLALGSTGADVTALQRFLKGKGYFTAEPTGYFGALTRQAVTAFQSANALEPVGHVGPRTRRLLNDTGASPSLSSASVGQIFTRALDLGSRGDDVTTLQRLLRSKGYLNAEPTGYYGSLTHEAVKQFQQVNNFEAVGTIGPKTRVLLNALAGTSVLGNGITVSDSTNTYPSPALSISPQGASSSGRGGGGSAGTSAPTPATVGTTPTVVGVFDIVPPSTPAGLVATAVSSNQIDLTWSASVDNVGVTGYKIFRDGIQIGTSARASYADKDLAASTVYSYTVVSYDAGNNSSPQSAAFATITLGTAPLAITIGSRVMTTANLNVRTNAGFNMISTGSHPIGTGTEGTVVAGPVSADGRVWWQIDYDTGVDGWSIADYLVVIVSASSSPAVGLKYAPVLASAGKGG